MVKPTLSICSTSLLLVNEFEKRRTICQKKDYFHIVHRHANWYYGIFKYQGKQKTHTATVPASEFDKRRMFVEIPYIGEQTRSLKKHIN